MNKDVLDTIRRHALQGVTDPRFAKDQCALILELIDQTPRKRSAKDHKYAHMAAHFARGLHLAGVRPMDQSAMIAALWFDDAKGWWGVERPTTPDGPVVL